MLADEEVDPQMRDNLLASQRSTNGWSLNRRRRSTKRANGSCGSRSRHGCTTAAVRWAARPTAVPVLRAGHGRRQAGRRGGYFPHRLPAVAGHGLLAAWRAGCRWPRCDQPGVVSGARGGAPAEDPGECGGECRRPCGPGAPAPWRAILLEDKTGVPKFLGVEQTAAGFSRNGYPLALGRERAYAGCHWSGLPAANIRSTTA